MPEVVTTIYALVDPETDEVRYVGKTTNPDRRYEQHLQASQIRHTHCQRWVAKLLTRNLRPQFKILEVVTGERWAEAERNWIAEYRLRGANLTNHTDGGEGTPGYTHSEDARVKLRTHALTVGRIPPQGRESVKQRAATRSARYSAWLQTEAGRAWLLYRAKAAAKLTDEQVRGIFYATGTQREIAKQFSVLQQTVCSIKNRRTYAYVDLDAE